MLHQFLRPHSSLLLVAGALALAVSGCSAEGGPNVEVTSLDQPVALPEWSVFLNEARRIGRNGEVYYIVEMDIPILTEGELAEYYQERLKGTARKGVAHLYNGGDDVWLNDDELRLRYCVDTGFDAAPAGGRTTAEMIAAMETATTAWEQVANVQFTYDPGNNGNCGVASPIPDALYIKVSRDDTQNGACAFGPQSHANWTCAGLDGNTIGVNDSSFSAAAIPGVMMHELGHTLGLHHEQFHTQGGGCTASGVRDVTASVDLISIMGYTSGQQACALTTPGSVLSPLDGWTMRTFYGMPAAWYVAVL